MNEIIITEMLKKQEQTLNKIERSLSRNNTGVGGAEIEQMHTLSHKLMAMTKSIGEVRSAVQKPVVVRKTLHVDINCTRTFYLVLGLVFAVVLLGMVTYKALQPRDMQLVDNDLKYRYIKMKGTATAKQIAHLEDLFEQNRNPAAIKEMRQIVKSYEQTIRKRAILDEQTRLNTLESEKLNNEVKKIQENNSNL